MLAVAVGAAAGAEEKPAIAVLDFKGVNASAGDAEAVTQFVRNAVVNSGAYTVVEKQNMDRVLAEQAFQQAGCTEADCAVKLGKILNVRMMMVGSYTIFEGNRTINAWIVDVETGEVVKADSQKIADPSQIDVGASFLVNRMAGDAAKAGGGIGGPDAPKVKSYDEIPVFNPLDTDGAEYEIWESGLAVLVFSVRGLGNMPGAMDWAVWTREMVALALAESGERRVVRVQAGCNLTRPLLGEGRLDASCGTKYVRLAKVAWIVGGALEKSPTGGPPNASIFMLGRDGTQVSRADGLCDQAGIRAAVNDLLRNRRVW